ncbi:MAG: polyisoprenoid-binding protein [Chitinophagaceae bacterium]|nr:MAG: polyisoprenoid-binding protein [Chitinophagaceae bacterium]
MKMHNWRLDAAHSQIQFKARYLLISSVSGVFRKFSGALFVGDTATFENATLSAIIDTYSVDTNETERDEHLKTAEFLNADVYPEITINGSNFRHISGDRFEFNAEVSINGTTKTIVMHLDFGGEAKDGFGNLRAGLELSGKINRKDFGIHYNTKTDSGGLVIGEEIQLHANLQFVREL